MRPSAGLEIAQSAQSTVSACYRAKLAEDLLGRVDQCGVLNVGQHGEHRMHGCLTLLEHSASRAAPWRSEVDSD